jgi:hypothetical protein
VRRIAICIPIALATVAGAQAPAGGWPRAIALDQGKLTVYTPQVETFEGVQLAGRAAVSWEAAGAKAPVFGVFWFDARVLIDKERREVQVEELHVTKVRFPNAKPEQEQRVAQLIEAQVLVWDLTPSLDDLQASVAASQRLQKSEKGIAAPTPKLIFSTEPAVLLPYDGEPATRPLGDSGLERVVNTPLFVVRDPSNGKFYLGSETLWYESAAAKGPWTPVAAPTPKVKSVFDANKPAPQAAPSGGEPSPEVAQQGQPAPASAGTQKAPDRPPRIVVATEPTELVVFDGTPSWAPLGNDGNLLYADNTDGKVIVHVPTSETFVLVSGRWYKASSLKGPWTPVRPDKLPAAFKSIPPDSAVGDLRAFVTGTAEADDALADSQIPQTAAVKRDQTIQVTYDGEPKFKAIEGTSMSYAVNSSFSVIQDGGKYWVCHQAVWYVSSSPKGPWVVSDKTPPSVDQIPPSAPVYNVKYVHVYQATPEVVYVGYLPGYVGVYPYYGTVVYGTGFYYPPYVGPVVCYPRPATFGVHVGYSPWTGWRVGVSYGTPFFSVGVSFGGYGGYYGPRGYYPPPRPPYGYRPPPPGYRPPYYGGRPPPPAGYRPPAGSAPGRPSASQPIAGAEARDNLYHRAENANRNAPQAQPSERRPAASSSQPNNVYADRSGNVYRQNQGGSWDRNTSGGWQQADGGKRPQGGASSGSGASAAQQQSSSRGAAPSGLSQDAAARGRGGGGRGGGGGGRRR